MGYRFWRRVRIAPELTINLSKSGASLSFGPRGAHYTLGPSGKRVTTGIPGTGLFYTHKAGGAGPYTPSVQPGDKLTIGFFRRLITPDGERALVDGCRELALGEGDRAFNRLKEALYLADGAYLAGFLALKTGRLNEAADYLQAASLKFNRLGRYFQKYGVSAVMSLPITDDVTAHVGPTLRGVLLGLVEVCQRRERWQEAMAYLERLRKLAPDDIVVKLSLCELLLESKGDNRKLLQRVVRLAGDVKNETPVHTALLLYKARALRGLGLAEAAKTGITMALRYRKGRSEELMHALRYERAMAYEDLGQKKKARNDLEKLYGMVPRYKDVAARLGV